MQIMMGKFKLNFTNESLTLSANVVCLSRKTLSVPEVSQLVSKPIVSLGYFILMIVVLVVGIEVLWWWWWATNRCLSLANNTHANKSWLKVSWSFQKFLGLFCGESERGVCVCAVAFLGKSHSNHISIVRTNRLRVRSFFIDLFRGLVVVLRLLLLLYDPSRYWGVFPFFLFSLMKTYWFLLAIWQKKITMEWVFKCLDNEVIKCYIFTTKSSKSRRQQQQEQQPQ